MPMHAGRLGVRCYTSPSISIGKEPAWDRPRALSRQPHNPDGREKSVASVSFQWLFSAEYEVSRRDAEASGGA